MSSAVLDIDYAKLYSRASQRSETLELTRNMYVLDHLLSQSYDIRYLLKSNDLSIEKRIQVLLEVPGFSQSQTFEELLYLILERRQLLSFRTIYEKYIASLVVEHGFSVVEAVFSLSLSESFVEEIRKSLENALKTKVVLMTSVDPTLVGGVILKLPDGKIFDYSYRKRMHDFKSYVMEKGLS